MILWLGKKLQPRKREMLVFVPCASIPSQLGCPGFDQQLRMSLKNESMSSLQKGLSLCAVPGKVFLVPDWGRAVP